MLLFCMELAQIPFPMLGPRMVMLFPVMLNPDVGCPNEIPETEIIPSTRMLLFSIWTLEFPPESNIPYPPFPAETLMLFFRIFADEEPNILMPNPYPAPAAVEEVTLMVLFSMRRDGDLLAVTPIPPYLVSCILLFTSFPLLVKSKVIPGEAKFWSRWSNVQFLTTGFLTAW